VTTPGGRPKVDLATEIARALFEQDGEAIFAGFKKVLRKGSPYAFQVLSDPAFGKLKETHAIERSPYKDQSDADLEARIRELEEKLRLSVTCRAEGIAAGKRNKGKLIGFDIHARHRKWPCFNSLQLTVARM